MIKKTPAKKAAKKSAKKSAKKGVKKLKTSPAKAKKKPAKKVVKPKVKLPSRALSSNAKKNIEKQLLEKQANFIANTEKKRSTTTKRIKTKTTALQSNSLINSIIDGMQDKKAKNITLLNLTGLENRIADFFVICDADSTTHVDAIANSVEDMVKTQAGEKPFHSEGYQNSQWILIDYINVVVHVFLKEIREYYNIEGLWGDAEIKLIH